MFRDDPGFEANIGLGYYAKRGQKVLMHHLQK